MSIGSNANPLGNNGLKRTSGIVIGMLLIFGTVAGIMAISTKQAFAAVDVQTSTTKIYGNVFVRVLVTDSAKTLGTDTALVTVDVKHGSSTVASPSVTVPAIGTSGQFEFFIATRNGDPASPTFSTTGGVVLRLNGSIADGNDVANAATVLDGDSYVITYGGQSKTVQFSSTIAAITTDRSTAGSDNAVIIRVTDNDANSDPTAKDTFTASAATIQAIIGGVNKLAYGAGIFTESGQNTGIFELTVTIGGATTPLVNTTGIALPQSATLKVTDHKIYPGNVAPADRTIAADAPTSSTPGTSVTLQNVDGTLSLASPATFANGLQIRITDADRNINTDSTNDLAAGAVTVSVEGLAGTVSGVAFKETDDNTGMFKPDITDDRIPINIVSGASSVTATAINLNASMVASDPDITIIYNDPADGNNAATAFTLVKKLTHTAGSIVAPAKVGVVDSFALTLNDPDLNTSPTTSESYIVTFAGTVGGVDTGNKDVANGAGSLTLKVKGSTFLWKSGNGPDLVVTFIEDGVNTGNFVANNVDMGKINSQISGGLKDGDQVKFTYTDNMESPAADSDSTTTIGKPSAGISVDRSTVPVPLAGSPVKVKVQITDSTKNTNTGSTDSFSFLDTGITVTKSDGSTVGGTPGTAISGLSASKTFTETDLSTGVFEATYTLSPGTLTLSDLNGAKVKFTYTSGSNTESVSITLKAYDGVLTASTGSVANGVNLVVTVNDQDGNRDPTTKESLTITGQGKSDEMTLASFSLDETDVNSGVFTKTIIVGSDLRISDLSTNKFSTSVEFHYNDDVASDSTTSVDRELILNVGTYTGTVTVTPEVVGPGTKVTIIVDDKDLNMNPDGTDTTASATDYLRITSDRSGVNTLSTGITGEETGPNTGMFKTKLTLTPLKSTDSLSTAFSGSGKDITGKVLPGDLIQLRYTDQKNAAGSKVTVAKTFKVVSVDPEFTTNVDSVQAGDSFTLSVADTDANSDGDAVDSIKIRVTSTSDPVGYDVTALETGPNTGVFTATVTTTTSVSAGSITVRSGDQINLKYSDKYPADYADRVKTVVDPSKDFSLNVSVGTSASTKSTTPSKTITQDITGRTITEVKAGQQVLLGATVHNNEDTQRNFVAIIQVEDADGIVVSIGAVGGIVPVNGDSPVAVSFTPDASGNYTVKVFVLSSFATPTILATPSSTTVNVR